MCAMLRGTCQDAVRTSKLPASVCSSLVDSNSIANRQRPRLLCVVQVDDRGFNWKSRENFISRWPGFVFTASAVQAAVYARACARVNLISPGPVIVELLGSCCYPRPPLI